MTPLQLHVEAWKDCTRCELHKGRRRVVPGRGSVPCDILFIGEAPGKSEDVLGQAFVGPAGHMLDSVIADALAYFPDAVYSVGFSNVIACIPKDAEGTKSQQPPDWAAKQCIPRLGEFLMLCEPKLVVAVGKYAEDWTDPGWKPALKVGVPRVAITHPAAVLRALLAKQPAMRRSMVIGVRDAIRRHLRNGDMP